MKLIQFLTVSLLIFGTQAVDKTWWKHATMYEVFLKSFKDSNGDGIGDLKGVISKLDYFVDIGIDTVWITPYFSSSMADGGYDITNFYEIDPTFGTMEDFEELVKEMQRRGLNFVMDLVINHSSDEHEWFQKSIKKIHPYTDYYIWVDPKGYEQNGNPIPPNNWGSIFDFESPSSCWTWNEQRKQYYFHQFGIKQPDFDLRNKNVKNDLKNMMKFWLHKGVSAFRVDATPFFLEDPQLRDDSYNLAKTGQFSHRYHHPDTIGFLNELHLFLRQYDRKHGKDRQSVMMTEGYGPISTIMSYYGSTKMPAAHFPFNFLITTLNKYLDAHQMVDYLNMWLKNKPQGAASNWALGNHDRGRIFQQFSKEYNYILLALVTMLPGTSTIYYGEEITQDFFDFSPERVKNLLLERDHFRSPMQWDDTLNAGFTSAEKSWIPLHPNYWTVNVKAQKIQQNSTLNYFKDLTSIRKTDTFKFGDLKFYPISKWILAFVRTYNKSKYITVLNLGTESTIVDLHANIHDLPAKLTVAVASANSGFIKGQKLSSVPNYPNLTVLRPFSALILAVE